MKKVCFLLALLGAINLFAQQKETPVTTIGSMTIKINLNQATSIATITLTGPSTKWLAIGFNATAMTSNTDCFTYATSLLDQSLPGGHNTPITDPTNNLTLGDNRIDGTTRTVVVTRPLSTGDPKDFTFNFASSSLNIIWAVGPSTNVNSQHSSFGTKNLVFNTLGITNFATLDGISLYPNPSNGIFSISKNGAIQISKIKIFDTNAKLLKEIESDVSNQINSIDLSELQKGMYFIEISNKDDKAIKKLILN